MSGYQGTRPSVTGIAEFVGITLNSSLWLPRKNNMYRRNFLRLLTGVAGLSLSAFGFDRATTSPSVPPDMQATAQATTENDPLCKILIIDDDWGGDMQILFKVMLIPVPVPRLVGETDEEYGNRLERTIDTRVKEAGFDLEFVTDADEGFRRYCENGPYDLVLTDVCHPGMAVTELIPAIRQKHPAQVIALFTAAHDPELPKRLRVPFLWKPFEAETLRRFVDEMIRR